MTSQARIGDIERQNQVQERQQEKQDKISLLELYRFAQGSDYVLLVLGTIFVMVAGCSFPWFGYLWGKIVDAFLHTNDGNARLQSAIYYRNIFFYVGLGALVSSWIGFTSWTVLSERMAVKCRKAYLKSLLRQDVGWYDQQNQLKLSSQFNVDALAYQKATGEKIGSMFNLFAMFACGAAISISIRWTMALVVLAIMPIIGFGCIIFIYLIYRKNSTFQQLYEQSDSCAHQALNSIKTVKSMNGQEFQFNRYSKYLNLLKEKVGKWAIFAGIGTGIFFFIQYSAFSFGFWYGAHCVAGSYRCPLSSTGSTYTPGQTFSVFFALFVGSFNFMQLLPNIAAINEGLKAAKRLYTVIDQQPSIKRDSGGIKKDKIQGKIKFEKVTFAYPKDKSKNVISNLSFQVDFGEINAFVGDSGCGKSTVFQLVMRFYDPDKGRITLDGHDLKEYDLQWLRAHIGYVGQQPCLFQGSILMNVLIGNSKASLEQVNQALTKAEALEFVQSLPEKLDYNVGYAGSQLSGGQKQRIAIARAILRNPQILILDEATSALDRRNEKLIQKTLDKISNGVTTLTISHRVKTIMHASKIFVLNSGTIQQVGKFKQLKRFKQFSIQVQSQGEKEIQAELKITKKMLNHIFQNFIKKESQYEGGVFSRLFLYTKEKRCYFVIGIIACIIAGGAHPCCGLLLAYMLNQYFNIYTNSNNNPSLASEYLENAEDYVLGVFILGICIFFPFMVQSILLTIVGEDMTEKIRKQVYQKMLKLPVKWFEQKANRGGMAANRFGVDSRQVNSLTTSLVSTLVMNASSIIGGLIIAFIFEWRLGLVGLISMPCMVISGFISMLFYGGFGDDNKKYYEQSSKICQETILNIRTVYSCCYEARLGQLYDQKLQYPLNAAFGKGTKQGLLYGFSQLILQFTFGCMFYFGALIMRDNPSVPLLNIFCGIYSIAWAGWYAGNNFYFMPDVSGGRQSAQNVFKILDSQDENQLQIRQGSKLLKTPIKGKIEFKSVTFKYDGASQPTLNSINMTINKGQKVAFVGTQGCGKSTAIQLLQKFYDCDGDILIDGIEIGDYDIHHLRSFFANVSQEPRLFKGTVKYNINYNNECSEQQTVQAAKKAEAMSFIQQSEQGLNRDIGEKGSQLTRAQKQRVAIARALVRKPQILMLDEATSALDHETEKKVQSNIDKEMNSKTRLVVDHRTEVIVNSDRIYLFDKGQILEEGNYNELMSRKKYFYNLQKV